MAQQRFMRLAIAKTREGMAQGQSPYGATIVRGNKVIACEHNIVGETSDPTAHAEVTAIRRACEKLKTRDLSGCEIYCTCEPCAMCMGACYSAKIGTIYFGAGIPDKFKLNLPDLGIGASAICRLSEFSPRVVPGLLRDECVELLRLYVKKANTAAPAANDRPVHKRGARRRP